MVYILHIDTSIQAGSVCLAKDGKSIGVDKTTDQRDTAAWIQPAIQRLLADHHLVPEQLDAIAVTGGPGSYTGLRVGMASAKGLCFGLNKPLIVVNTLKMMAFAALKHAETELLCPMIDARRMEVFTALFDRQLNELQPTMNLILDENTFRDVLSEKSVTFFGNGSGKFENILNNQNADFLELESDASDLVSLAWEKFHANDFVSLAYSAPLYGKAFFSPLFNAKKQS